VHGNESEEGDFVGKGDGKRVRERAREKRSERDGEGVGTIDSW